jgi:hypothetical protein
MAAILTVLATPHCAPAVGASVLGRGDRLARAIGAAYEARAVQLAMAEAVRLAVVYTGVQCRCKCPHHTAGSAPCAMRA